MGFTADGTYFCSWFVMGAIGFIMGVIMIFALNLKGINNWLDNRRTKNGRPIFFK